MTKRRLYCPLVNQYCKHSAKDGDNAICRLSEKPLYECKECPKDAIYQEKHKVEIWFSKEGWQKRHLFMRGTCFEKDDLSIIFDYGGIAIQKKMQNLIRIRNLDELKNLLSHLFPDWLITELSKRIKTESKK